ncbi:MAG: GatB/YqeY domain-containing protein [Spirochaetia bacterium]|nr:GatB/YqeY domain-containing protein [Spirochaetia bacterium]
MSLSEKLGSDLKEAMKAKDETRLNCIRQVKTAVMNAEIKKGLTLSDEEIISVIFSLSKAHADSIEAFKNAGRNDLLEKEEKELAILKSYLPQQLSDDEIRKIVGEAAASSGASSIKETGKLMALVMPKVKGKADGNRVNAIVKEILSGGL